MTGGYYLARQRESSAVLDTISTGKNPAQVGFHKLYCSFAYPGYSSVIFAQVHWEITKSIITIKQELRENVLDLDELHKRSVELITKPIICKYERDIYTRITECQFSDQIVKLVTEAIMTADEEANPGNNKNKELNAKNRSATPQSGATGLATFSTKTDMSSSLNGLLSTGTVAAAAGESQRPYTWSLSEKHEAPPNFEFKPQAFNENELDIINIVRLGFESLNRICLKGKW
jgi:hypothetical protein